MAFIGPTGSGKTTTVDIILGLLKAQKGVLEVDNQPINDNNDLAWQKIIGYVPQNIFLSDDTVEANIAFGTNSKNIDKNAVHYAAKIANIHDFIINDLPSQYQTTVGERGIRLSGGQRQRIGIARALYNNPQILIMDEATSALDNITEKAVMDSIHKLKKKMTIILIAHRLSTVKDADCIYVMDKGCVAEYGSHEELLLQNGLYTRLWNTQFKEEDA